MAYASAGKDKCQVIVDVFVFLLATAPPIKARRLLHFAVHFSYLHTYNQLRSHCRGQTTGAYFSFY